MQEDVVKSNKDKKKKEEATRMGSGGIMDIRRERESGCSAKIIPRHSASVWLPQGKTESRRRDNPTENITCVLTGGFHCSTVLVYIRRCLEVEFLGRVS